MSTRRIISGVNFTQSIGKAMPDIPGLLSLGFFGTGGDGINGNRAPGPAFSNSGNVPAYSSNFVTLGRPGVQATATATVSGGAVTGVNLVLPGSMYVAPPLVIFSGPGTGASATAVLSGGQVIGFSNLVGGSGFASPPAVTLFGGNVSGIDLGVTRASVLTPGWTCAVVARAPASGFLSTCVADTVSASTVGFVVTMAMRNVDGGHGNSPTATLIVSVERSFVITPTPVTNWRMIAYTYSGGTSGTWNLYSLSDNLTGTPYTIGAVGTQSGQQFHLGPHNASLDTASNIDIAAAMVSSGPLPLATLQTLYASWKGILANRGVVVV